MSSEMWNVAVVFFTPFVCYGIGLSLIVRTYCPVLPVLSDAAMLLRNVQEETGLPGSEFSSILQLVKSSKNTVGEIVQKEVK